MRSFGFVCFPENPVHRYTGIKPGLSIDDFESMCRRKLRLSNAEEFVIKSVGYGVFVYRPARTRDLFENVCGIYICDITNKGVTRRPDIPRFVELLQTIYGHLDFVIEIQPLYLETIYNYWDFQIKDLLRSEVFERYTPLYT